MGRLTSHNELPVNDMNHYNKVLRKLQKLENIEEELGISLIDFYLALKNPIYVIDDDGNIVDDEIERVFINDGYFTTHNEMLELDFKDLGKTWALTREELKNE